MNQSLLQATNSAVNEEKSELAASRGLRGRGH